MARTPGSKNKKKKPLRKAPKITEKTEVITVDSMTDNPFELKNDLVFTGNRGNNNVLVSALLEQCLKLSPGDVRNSVNIPTTVAPVIKQP